MTLPLTTDMLAAAYEYLCCAPPFSKWNMPPSEDVKFKVIKHKDRQAHYYTFGDVHHIEISSHFVGSHNNILATMSHEMIHLHISQACLKQRGHHDKTFNKYADRVCKIHGFDRLVF
jgi:hypothetical protein